MVIMIIFLMLSIAFVIGTAVYLNYKKKNINRSIKQDNYQEQKNKSHKNKKQMKDLFQIEIKDNFVFEKDVQKGFKNHGTQIIVTANNDLKNNQIIENHTYLTADYLEVDLIDKDEFHTIVRIPEKTTLTGVLPRTGK